MSGVDPSVRAFNQDVLKNEGYLYTTHAALSSQLATQRHKDILLGLNVFSDRNLLDMGCGDGFYTRYFWDTAKPRSLTAIDAASSAIEMAEANKKGRAINFEVGDIHHINYPDNNFDVALIQGVLHHDDRPQQILREAFRLAPQIIVLEPNGYNLGLKIIEKLSPYHRAHREKSYAPATLNRWIREAGGKVTSQIFAGFVPIFCPDWLAISLKKMEPIIEALPLISALGCAVNVVVANRVSATERFADRSARDHAK